MKKKLLTILLSIFMSLGCFVNVVHADITTINDVLNVSNIPEMTGSSIPEGAWTNNNGGFLVIEEDVISFTNAEHTNCYTKSIYDDVTNNGNGTYVYTNGTVYVTFIISDNTLVNVIVSGLSDYLEPLNGTYTAPITIADILPGNFPASDEDESWCNSKENNDVYIYNDGTYLVFAKTSVTNVVLVSSVLTKAEKDPTWSDTTTCRLVYSTDDIVIQFNMTGDDGNELENIVVAHCPFEACEGTYNPPAVKVTPYIKTNPEPSDIDLGKKLSDSTLFGGYVQVSSTDSTQIAGLFEWTNPNTVPALADSNLTLYSVTFTPIDTINYTTVSCQVIITVNHATHNPILVNGQAPTEIASGWKDYYECVCGNYYEDAAGSVLIPNLAAWKAEGGNGYIAPLTPAKTIADILATVPGGFPTTETSGWVKDNNSTRNRIYKDGNNLIIGTSPFSLNGVVTKEGNNYKHTSGMVFINFIMESNVLKKINFTVMSATASGDYVPYIYEIEPTESKSQGYTGTLVFETNGQYTNDSDVVVKVDGTPLTLNTDYQVEHGSIKVTLLGSYIKNLVPKTYTISIGVPESYDEITSQFTITAAPSPSSDPTPRYKVPNTGVECTYSNNHSLLKLSSLSLLAIGAYIVIKKKKGND